MLSTYTEIRVFDTRNNVPVETDWFTSVKQAERWIQGFRDDNYLEFARQLSIQTREVSYWTTAVPAESEED